MSTQNNQGQNNPNKRDEPSTLPNRPQPGTPGQMEQGDKNHQHQQGGERQSDAEKGNQRQRNA